MAQTAAEAFDEAATLAEQAREATGRDQRDTYMQAIEAATRGITRALDMIAAWNDDNDTATYDA